jgi:hypothetical protein
LRVEEFGLTLSEAKSVLQGLQQALVQSLCVDGSPSEFFKIADRAVKTAFHNSGIVAEEPPNVRVLNCCF